jgi:hypothetical protein
MTTQSSLSEKGGATGEVGWTTRTVHQHRAQVALRTGVTGVGRNSIQPSSENIVPRNRGVPCLETTCKLKKRLGFAARRGKLRDRGDYGRLGAPGDSA